MLRLLLHWHIHFIKSFFIQILSSVFTVTLEGVCEGAKGFSGMDPATTDFEGGILEYFGWDLQLVIIINIAWLHTTLGAALGREKGGPRVAIGGLCPGARVRLWRYTWWTKTQLGVLGPHSSLWRVITWRVANPLHPTQASHLAPSPVSLRASSWHSSIQGRWPLSYGNEPIKGDYRGTQLASFLSCGSAIELKIERWWTGEFSAAYFLTHYISSTG